MSSAIARVLGSAVAVTVLIVAGCSSDPSGSSPTATAGGTTVAADVPASTNGPPILVETKGDAATIQVQVGTNDFETSGGTRVLSIPKGTSVTIELTDPNNDQEYHLHGYDLEASAKKGETAKIEFVADQSGQFDVESHVSEATLLVLVVV